MYEIELHDLWRSKDIPIDLKLVDGRPLSVIHFGHYNERLSGPDFSMGIIHLDGLDLIGPIELHIKSSDWYRHNHHLDANYDNVILHVVYHHDMEVVQNKRIIPTLELKKFFEPKLKFDSRASMKLPCASFISEVNYSLMNDLKLKALETKYATKMKSLNLEKEEYQKLALYKLLGNAFGFSVNANQFEELTERVPVESLIVLSPHERIQSIMTASDAFIPKDSFDPTKHIKWHKKGLAPSGFPKIRVKQFALVVAYLLFDEGFVKDVKLAELNKIKRQMIKISGTNDIKISDSTINHLLLNCIIPFQYFNRNNSCKIDDIKIILVNLKAEVNRITRLLKSQGFKIENAFDSQSLIAHFKDSCSRKKCLSCNVGKLILNRLN